VSVIACQILSEAPRQQNYHRDATVLKNILTMLELGNSAARLEPFLLMSKSAKGAAAAKLVQDAMSAPGVFVFAELLELPNIQEVCIRSVSEIPSLIR
jgi:CSN7 helical bundle subdomain